MLDEAAVVAAEPPRPVYTIPAELVVAPAGRLVAVEVVEVVTLTRVGFWAPQGLSALQLLEQMLSEPHAATHCWPYSVQMKYGRVWEYSEAFGDCPFEQTQS